MPLSTTHPQYDEFKDDWVDMRYTYKGQRAVKSMTIRYLPATPSHQLDGMEKGQDGLKDYTAYMTRAVFYDYVREGVQALVGMMYNKPPTITLPAAMEPLRSRISNNGEGVVEVLRRINVEQLITGRIGLLVDMPQTPDPANPLPFIALYCAESIINWDDGDEESLRLVVLDESAYERIDVFNWDWVKRHRVLMLGVEGSTAGVYHQGLFVDENFVSEEMKPPMLRGKTLKNIPFTFINSGDLVPSPDSPPLIGLAILALAIYRADADYRQSLFMQGQDTLVTIGLKSSSMGGLVGEGEAEPLRTGSGARIDLDINGDAKYIGVESSGLSEQRAALEADHERAGAKAGQFATKSGNERESGESLKTRITAQTATLKQIAITGAAGLQQALRSIAEWMGANPEEVLVEPNLEFADLELGGDEVIKLMTARSMGAPLSLKTIHAIMALRGLTKFDYETEIELVGEEIGAGLGGPIVTEDDDKDDE